MTKKLIKIVEFITEKCFETISWKRDISPPLYYHSNNKCLRIHNRVEMNIYKNEISRFLVWILGTMWFHGLFEYQHDFTWKSLSRKQLSKQSSIKSINCICLFFAWNNPFVTISSNLFSFLQTKQLFFIVWYSSILYRDLYYIIITYIHVPYLNDI